GHGRPAGARGRRSYWGQLIMTTGKPSDPLVERVGVQAGLEPRAADSLDRRHVGCGPAQAPEPDDRGGAERQQGGAGDEVPSVNRSFHGGPPGRCATVTSDDGCPAARRARYADGATSRIAQGTLSM